MGITVTVPDELVGTVVVVAVFIEFTLMKYGSEVELSRLPWLVPQKRVRLKVIVPSLRIFKLYPSAQLGAQEVAISLGFSIVNLAAHKHL